MKPSTFTNRVASILYEKRWSPYFVSPIVAGLENGKPILATYDSIGCLSNIDPFVVQGTATETLYGLAEAFYKPDLEPQVLSEVVAQILTTGADRDIYSGWGGLVYLLTPGGLEIKVLKTKQSQYRVFSF
eukprot:TRINITY_DN1419_c0_g1_i4.p2 TRINITY_DN1419_c0_g1~~TRINITY_DN1419_c0_g1_i4.p2  ORF type:complete len:130 (+),score=26.05 TRINITY_DN1419_c0_g1_i4:146-535(+)